MHPTVMYLVLMYLPHSIGCLDKEVKRASTDQGPNQMGGVGPRPFPQV